MNLGYKDIELAIIREETAVVVLDFVGLANLMLPGNARPEK